jgi:hypothetical protein
MPKSMPVGATVQFFFGKDGFLLIFKRKQIGRIYLGECLSPANYLI